MTKILIVEARFYGDISDALLAGATAVLKAQNAEYDTVTVPGAPARPRASSRLARNESENSESGGDPAKAIFQSSAAFR